MENSGVVDEGFAKLHHFLYPISTDGKKARGNVVYFC